MPKTFIHAACNGVLESAHRSFFFKGAKYRRYNWNTDQLDDGGSLPVFAWHLPEAFQSGVDAALNGTAGQANSIYFFKGAQYVRYNWATNRVDFGPEPIARWWKLSGTFAQDLDAALPGEKQFAGFSYFFKENRYARYNWKSDTVDVVAGLDAWNFPEPFRGGIDAAVNGRGKWAGKAYFFKGNQYLRYDWASGKVDEGFPTEISTWWKALLGLNGRTTRRVVPYVTIDPWNHHPPGQAGVGGAHEKNFGGVRSAAQQQQPNSYTDDLWMPELTGTMLADPHLLALFLAGSFAEWVEAYRNRAWRARLDRLGAQVRATQVPILAVCGSHQLVARTYGGWGVVGHMAPASGLPIPIDAEADGTYRGPDPRPGEVGVYGHRGEAPDYILEGLNDPAFFVEYHHDAVIRLPPTLKIVSLLRPERLATACQKPAYNGGAFTHEPLQRDGQRATAQLLRYHVPPQGRLLYTAQFHPELAWTETVCGHAGTAAADGTRLIRNFVLLAADFWQNR